MSEKAHILYINKDEKVKTGQSFKLHTKNNEQLYGCIEPLTDDAVELLKEKFQDHPCVSDQDLNIDETSKLELGSNTLPTNVSVLNHSLLSINDGVTDKVSINHTRINRYSKVYLYDNAKMLHASMNNSTNVQFGKDSNIEGTPKNQVYCGAVVTELTNNRGATNIQIINHKRFHSDDDTLAGVKLVGNDIHITDSHLVYYANRILHLWLHEEIDERLQHIDSPFAPIASASENANSDGLIDCKQNRYCAIFNSVLSQLKRPNIDGWPEIKTEASRLLPLLDNDEKQQLHDIVVKYRDKFKPIKTHGIVLKHVDLVNCSMRYYFPTKDSLYDLMHKLYHLPYSCYVVNSKVQNVSTTYPFYVNNCWLNTTNTKKIEFRSVACFDNLETESKMVMLPTGNVFDDNTYNLSMYLNYHQHKVLSLFDRTMVCQSTFNNKSDFDSFLQSQE